MRVLDKVNKGMFAVLFLVVIGVMGLCSSPLEHAYSLCSKAAGSLIHKEGMGGQEEYDHDIYKRDLWIDLNGVVAKGLNIRGLYKELGMYVLDDGYIVSSAGKTSTDYEYDQLTSFQNFLDERGTQLLYVNAPTKYLDDQIFMREFGIPCFSNQNADRLFQRITEAGISNIDLRAAIKEDGRQIYAMFYRTDHHWTTDSGLWAAGKVAEALNADFGYHIDERLYDPGNYETKLYKKCWLGEQGRKVARSYVGLDDYLRLEPSDTIGPFEMTLEKADGTEVSGDFSIFIDEEYYRFHQDVYQAPSMHYSYMSGGIHQTKVTNENVSDGKILLLADSYSQAVVPFLALGVSRVDTLVLRNYTEDLYSLIDREDYDTVIILYAQFMIGAHDQESSANYKMFTFRP